MVVSTQVSPPRLPVEKAVTACHASGQILVLDRVVQEPDRAPILLDRSRQFIGRDAECSIQLPDSDLPSRHAVILRGKQQLVIKAFDSRTWLNERLEKFGEGPCAFVLGPKKSTRYAATSKTRWFGVDISWFDPDKLGWHLGFE